VDDLLANIVLPAPGGQIMNVVYLLIYNFISGILKTLILFAAIQVTALANVLTNIMISLLAH
jgi:hypothetical protein